MKVFDKRARIIATIDIVLLLLVIFGFVFLNAKKTEKKFNKALLITDSEPARIVIETEPVLELKNISGKWFLYDSDGYLPADSDRVKSFIKTISINQKLEPVANNKTSWASLGLEGEDARPVSLFDNSGNLLLHFVLGAYAIASEKVYIAFDDGMVYTSPSGLASYIKGQRSSWLDLNLWTINTKLEDIEEFIVKGRYEDDNGDYKAIDYSIKRKGQGWEAENKMLNSSKVDSTIRAFLSMRASDYTEANVSINPLLNVELRLGNGRKLELSLGKRLEDGRFIALSDQRDRAVYLAAWAVEEAIKPLDYYR